MNRVMTVFSSFFMVNKHRTPFNSLNRYNNNLNTIIVIWRHVCVKFMFLFWRNFKAPTLQFASNHLYCLEMSLSHFFITTPSDSIRSIFQLILSGFIPSHQKFNRLNILMCELTTWFIYSN